MWIKYFSGFAALFAAGCAVSPPAPLSATHPAHTRAASVPLVQPQVLSTYRPAVETRTEPEKNIFNKDVTTRSNDPATSMDHSTRGHGSTPNTQSGARTKSNGAAPADAMTDHAAMGHGEAKARPPHTQTKPKTSTKPAPKDARHGHH